MACAWSLCFWLTEDFTGESLEFEAAAVAGLLVFGDFRIFRPSLGIPVDVDGRGGDEPWVFLFRRFFGDTEGFGSRGADRVLTPIPPLVLGLVRPAADAEL